MNFKHLYIHVPFCRTKCSYCAFYSIADADKNLRKKYLEKLSAQFTEKAAQCSKLETIFIGGGTPVELRDNELEFLLKTISAQFAKTDNYEFTVECNPESLNTGKIRLLSKYGVNRLSIGIQSFSREFRRRIGRAGSIAGLRGKIDEARKAGIENINCDMIYNIPGQSVEEWKNELMKLFQLKITHISAYSLTVEEKSRLAENQIEINENLSAEMWKTAVELLNENKFEIYEISNYAQKGFECRHNSAVWKGENYLGLGPAASSYNGKSRWTEKSDISEWLSGKEVDKDIISSKRRAMEILIVGLRTKRGWLWNDFFHKTAFTFEIKSSEIEELIYKKLLKFENNNLYPTEEGMLFWDTIAEKLI